MEKNYAREFIVNFEKLYGKKSRLKKLIDRSTSYKLLRSYLPRKINRVPRAIRANLTTGIPRQRYCIREIIIKYTGKCTLYRLFQRLLRSSRYGEERACFCNFVASGFKCFEVCLKWLAHCNVKLISGKSSYFRAVITVLWYHQMFRRTILLLDDGTV